MKNEGLRENQFLEKIADEKIIIYGCGYVAERFWSVLCQKELSKNVIGFLQTKKDNKSSSWIPNTMDIWELSEYTFSEDDIICIAVHEINAIEILKQLKNYRNRVKDIIWIYPILSELEFSEDGATIKMVKISSILEKNKKDFKIAAKYAVIADYYSNGEYYKNIYFKTMGAISTKETNEKRLNNYISMAGKWCDSNNLSSDPIIINEDYFVIDGTHRLALAAYNNQREILCLVLKGKSNEIGQFHRRGIICIEDKDDLNYTNTEKQLILNAQAEMLKKYKVI